MYKITTFLVICLAVSGCTNLRYGKGTLSPQVQAGVTRAMESYTTDTIAVSADGQRMSATVCKPGLGMCRGNAVDMAIRNCSTKTVKCYVYARGSTIVWDFDAKPDP